MVDDPSSVLSAAGLAQEVTFDTGRRRRGATRFEAPGSEEPPDEGGHSMTDVTQDIDTAREEARKQAVKRRNLGGGLFAYVVINAFLVGIWATTGHGYFWPGWVLGGWGIGMAMGVWDYYRRPVTEADIDRELRRMR